MLKYPISPEQMQHELFPSPQTDPTQNLLPKDGCVQYYGKILDQQKADDYLHALTEHIDWQNDRVFMFGKEIITKRKVAWYADKPYAYTYSNTTKKAHLWTEELLHLKMLVEKLSQCTFNSCLLNLYHNEQEGMAWHSDDEKTLSSESAIASLSFGAERKFGFKHKREVLKTSLLLEHGSLLLMKGATQSHWHHQLPPVKTTHGLRINLTFRTMV